MTKDELNRRCARKEGWLDISLETGFGLMGMRPGQILDNKWQLPDYTTDFNAAQRIIDMAVEKDAHCFGCLIDRDHCVQIQWEGLEPGHLGEAFHSKHIKMLLERALEVLDD